MGFLSTLKEVITNKPSNLRGPKFIKEFNGNNKEINILKSLLKKADEDTAKLIEEDIRLRTYGLYGEKNVAFELEQSNMPILILHDLNLKYKEKTAQIDYVVIAQKFILVIECKNMVGDITIDNNGAFIRSFKNSYGKEYKQEGMYSPITQNERHVELIKEIIRDKYKDRSTSLIKHCVVFSNEKTIISDRFAKREIKNSIVRCDQLIKRMKSLHDENTSGVWLTEKTMYSIADLLLSYQYEKYINYSAKYGMSVKDKNYSIKDKKPSVKDSRSFAEYKKPSISDNKTLVKDKKTPVKDKMILPKVEVKSSSDKLYNELRSYRYNKSKEENVQAYRIFKNDVLDDIVAKRPRTLEALMEINGMGNVKCSKYGKDILRIINKY